MSAIEQTFSFEGDERPRRMAFGNRTLNMPVVRVIES